MYDVMVPEVSAGSNHVGASETCTAHVIWPAGAPGAAAVDRAPPTRIRTTVTTIARRRTIRMAGSLPVASAALQLHVFVRRRERVAGDETDAGLLHPGSGPVQSRVQPDRRDHRLVVDELLDPVQRRLPPLGVDLVRLLQEEPVDVLVAPRDIGAAGGDERLDARRRVAEGATAALDEPLELLLRSVREEGSALHRPELHAYAGRVEIVDGRLAHVGDRGVAEVIASVEAVGVASLGQELLGLERIVPVARRLPVELEARGHDAPADLRVAERVRLVDRLSVDRVVRGQAHAPVLPQ